MTDAYLDYWQESGVNRARLLWTVAARRQLELWEPLVARHLRDRLAKRTPNETDIWLAQIEHHFALIAAGNLLQALALPLATSVSVDQILRAELKEGRDLHEHWPENMPVFNVTPRVAEPERYSGKRFAARNPDRSPYWWLRWSAKVGALLLPHVSASAVHELLDAVEVEVLASDPNLSRFIPPRAPSPWIRADDEWWPSPDEDVSARMMLAGVPVPTAATVELAGIVRTAGAEELADRLEKALADEVKILALTIAERSVILNALDDPPQELAELRAVLLNEHQWRQSEGMG